MSEKTKQLIKVHEGIKLKAYKDTKEIWSIGVGRNLESNFLTPRECRSVFDENPNYFANLGVKRSDVYDYLENHFDYFINIGITKKTADLLLENDIKEAEKYLSYFSYDDDLSECRRAVLVDMLFNLGAKRYSRFEDFIAALKAKHFAKAAAEIMDSKAAKIDAPARYKELHDMMLNNEFPKWVK